MLNGIWNLFQILDCTYFQMYSQPKKENSYKKVSPEFSTFLLRAFRASKISPPIFDLKQQTRKYWILYENILGSTYKFYVLLQIVWSKTPTFIKKKGFSNFHTYFTTYFYTGLKICWLFIPRQKLEERFFCPWNVSSKQMLPLLNSIIAILSKKIHF